jgi:hypothetical protein
MRRVLSSLKPSPAMAIAVTALLVASTGWAIAATSTNPVIRACANKKTGALRLASKCRHRERSVSWNVQGPAGLPGAKGQPGVRGFAGVQGIAGAQGLRGLTGATGPSGISGYEIVSGTPVASSGGGADEASTIAACPEGKNALAAGFSSTGENTQLFVMEDRPLGPTAWFIKTASAAPTAKYEITPWAVCATVTS